MIERVVVPVDFTPESDRALTVAQALADRAGVGVELVSVVPPIDRPLAAHRLAQVAGRLGDRTTWRCVESRGPVASCLAKELGRGEKELWCVGSHARGALGEVLVGSVSEDLVRRAHVPIVLVGPHGGAPRPGHRMAIALDGTVDSEAILPLATDLANALGMSVRLLQVTGQDLDPLPSDITETAVVAAAAKRMKSTCSQAADYDVLHGSHPAQTVADYLALHREVAMIALMTRGLRGEDRLRNGGTAFELVHRAVVPVVVLLHRC